MKSKICLFLTLSALLGMSAVASAVDGKWRGNLKMGFSKMPLVLNFEKDAHGKPVVTMDSPQQGATGIPFDIVHCSDDSLNITSGALGAVYTARIADGKIVGIFSQNGFNLPLTMTPEEDISVRRPQTPRPPFPYTEKDTVFVSSDGTELAGTLTLPAVSSSKKVPVVVMVTGSGPQNRDEEIVEHRPFAVIADHLARKGVASFRYDDRGVAKSKGNFQEATIDTFKADAKSALKFIRTLPGFGKAGILGHSEGGTIAVFIAAEDKPDFIVSLAGVATPCKDALLSQNIHLLDQSGISGSQRESSIKLIDTAFDMIIEQTRSGMSTPLDIDSICRANALDDVPEAVLSSIKGNMKNRNGYFDSLVSLDPTGALKKIKCPVLAINGTKDTQVNADVNLEAFRKNVKKAEIRRMEGLNHMMQHAKTGETTEYGDITETISPEVLQIITDFISQK